MNGKRKTQFKRDVGRRVAETRQCVHKRLSQSQLARLLSTTDEPVSPSKVNNWEKGRDLMPIGHAIRFQRILRDDYATYVSLDWFYNGWLDGMVSPPFREAILAWRRTDSLKK